MVCELYLGWLHDVMEESDYLEIALPIWVGRMVKSLLFQLFIFICYAAAVFY